jgi:Methyltransferase domain
MSRNSDATVKRTSSIRGCCVTKITTSRFYREFNVMKTYTTTTTTTRRRMTACRSCAIVMIALVVLLNLLPVYKTNHFTRTNTRSDDVHWDCSSDDTSRRQQLLAYQHSFGYFRDIPNSEWEQHYIARAIQSQPHYRYPHDHDRYTSTNQSASWIFSNWDPYFTCPHVRKIGGLDGGAKW